MYGNGATGKAIAPTRFLQLPNLIPKRNGVVTRRHAFRSETEDPIQIRAARFAERRAALLGWHRELLVKLCYVALAQELVGVLHFGCTISVVHYLRKLSAEEGCLEPD